MANDLISRQQLASSFRGIPFNVRSESADGGKRHIPHEYPNSNRRYVEDLGEIPPIFSINAFVHGIDYLKRASELEEALNQDGAGILSMPNFGTHSVFAMPYSKRASQKRVGEIIFRLTFQTGTDVFAPSQDLPSIEDVFDAGDDAREAIQSDFEFIYDTPIEITSVQTATNDVLFMVNSSVDLVKDNTENLSDIQAVSDRINDGIVNLVKSPSGLSSSLFSKSGLFQEISIGSTPSSEGIRSALLISDLGSSLTLWNPTTAVRIKRNKNRNNVVNSGQVAGLVFAYEQAAGAEYSTQDQVKDARVLLEDEYNRLMQDAIIDGELIQSMPGTRNAVENVRKLALEVLEQKQQQSFILTEIRQQTPISSILLTYQYYAESFLNSEQLLDKSYVIRDLNPTVKTNALIGDLKILQDAS